MKVKDIKSVLDSCSWVRIEDSRGREYDTCLCDEIKEAFDDKEVSMLELTNMVETETCAPGLVIIIRG